MTNKSETPISPIEDIIEDARNGRPYILVDAEDRENEGDVIIPAQMATPEQINFMAKHARGLICLSITADRARQLRLPPMAVDNRAEHSTAFTVSIEAKDGVTTGISVHDRARTVAVAIDPTRGADDIVSPGHVFPLVAKDGGVLVRAGHTEATVDLLKLAGLTPVGVIGEMVSEDGSMMRLPELIEVGARENLPVISIEQIVDYLNTHEIVHVDNPNNRIRLDAVAKLPTIHGNFTVRGYYDIKTTADHVAIIAGNPTGENVLIRMHSECITGEAFGSLKCECGPQLDYALDQIANDPNGGIVIYLRGQEGRGIGLLNKLRAYSLQDQGYDTVDANLALGLPSENREYGAAVAILRDMGVHSVRLMTNNPAKSGFLINAGIPVNEYVPILVGQALENAGYLETKRARMGHMIPGEQ